MIISFSKMNFQTNRIFHYYTVEMHFWKNYFFISNINEIYVVNILNQLIDDDNPTTIEDIHISNVELFLIWNHMLLLNIMRMRMKIDTLIITVF